MDQYYKTKTKTKSMETRKQKQKRKSEESQPSDYDISKMTKKEKLELWANPPKGVVVECDDLAALLKLRAEQEKQKQSQANKYTEDTDLEGYEEAFEDDVSCCSLSSDDRSLSERLTRESLSPDELIDELCELPSTHKYLNGNTNYTDIGILFEMCSKKSYDLLTQGHEDDAKECATAALYANDQVCNLVIKYKKIKKENTRLQEELKVANKFRSLGEMNKKFAAKIQDLNKEVEGKKDLEEKVKELQEELALLKERERKHEEEKKELVLQVTAAPVPLKEKSAAGTPAKLTYANAAKNRIAKLREGGTARHVVTVFPQNSEEKNSSKTQKVLQSCINPVKAGLHIKSVRPIGQGGLRIEGESKDDLEKLQKYIQELEKAGLSLKEPEKRRPRMVIYNSPNIDGSELLESIRFQGEAEALEIRDNVKPIARIGKRNIEQTNWVVEVSREMREALLKNPRVYIGWTSCPVKDYTVVNRCYRCQAFGHIAKHCRAVKDVCGHCAKEGHSYKDCPNKEEKPSCINCKRARKSHDHSSRSDECNAYKIARRNMILNTDYGDN